MTGRLSDLTIKIADLGDRIGVLAEESRAADQRLADRIQEQHQRLAGRIESLMSAMGEFISRQQTQS